MQAKSGDPGQTLHTLVSDLLCIVCFTYKRVKRLVLSQQVPTRLQGTAKTARQKRNIKSNALSHMLFYDLVIECHIGCIFITNTTFNIKHKTQMRT